MLWESNEFMHLWGHERAYINNLTSKKETHLQAKILLIQVNQALKNYAH